MLTSNPRSLALQEALTYGGHDGVSNGDAWTGSSPCHRCWPGQGLQIGETLRDEGLVPESEGFLSSLGVHPLTDPRPLTPLPPSLPTHPHHRRVLTWEIVTTGPSTKAVSGHEPLSWKHKASWSSQASRGNPGVTDTDGPADRGSQHRQGDKESLNWQGKAVSLRLILPCLDFAPLGLSLWGSGSPGTAAWVEPSLSHRHSDPIAALPSQNPTTETSRD